jgi:DNA-binding NarL/FixJ family response regulator
MSRVLVRRATSTPTEEKIARLAAEGFTNRNLARVYDKLGVCFRAELGRVMAGRDVKT